jgi:hypothetical protein
MVPKAIPVEAIIRWPKPFKVPPLKALDKLKIA